MESESERVPIVRLKYFLARQIDKHGENVTTQQATVLAAIMWMEQYGGRLLNQKELGDLLYMGETRMTAVVKALKRRGLIDEVEITGSKRGKRHKITDDGRESVLKFADEVLGIPQEIEDKLKERSDYASTVEASAERVDEFLRKHFHAITTKTSEVATDDVS